MKQTHTLSTVQFSSHVHYHQRSLESQGLFVKFLFTLHKTNTALMGTQEWLMVQSFMDDEHNGHCTTYKVILLTFSHSGYNFKIWLYCIYTLYRLWRYYWSEKKSTTEWLEKDNEVWLLKLVHSSLDSTISIKW